MPEFYRYHLPSLPALFNEAVPTYNSVVYRPFVARILKWDARYSEEIRAISQRRSDNRWKSYIDMFEITRVREKLAAKDAATMRFGVAKGGNGLHGTRGDFCITGASIDGKHLTLFYRALELIGGLAYDVVLIDALGKELGRSWRRVTIFAADARVIALKGNSSQKLYPKLQRIFE